MKEGETPDFSEEPDAEFDEFESEFELNESVSENPEFDSWEIEESRFSVKECYMRDSYYTCPIADRCNYEPADECICCGNLVVETFRDEGYFATRIGRAVAVAFPGYMKLKDGSYLKGLRVIIYSDPDAKMETTKDEFFFTGARFGFEDVYHNGHSIFGIGIDGIWEDSATFLLSRLNALIDSRDLEHPIPLREEERKRCREMVREMAELFGVKMKEDSYLPPKKILVVSERDSCVEPMVKAYLKFITRYDNIYVESAALKPSEFDKNARKAIAEVLGEEFANHKPQWIKEVEVIYDYSISSHECKTLLDHDLIIAVVPGLLKELPKERTVTLREVVEDYVDAREPKSLEECRAFIKDLKKNYISIISNISGLLGVET